MQTKKEGNKYNFTKVFIESLKIPKAGQRSYYKDAKVNGLEIMVTSSGHKSFKVTKKKEGKFIRITLGGYPDLSVENARKKALEVNTQLVQGVNPNEERNQLRKEMVFGDLFALYMERYSKKFKRSWKYDEREVNKFLSHWFRKKISEIKNQEIRLLHEKIRDKNGLYQANRLLERVRAIYNKAIEWGYKGENPADNIKKFKETSRDRFIQPDELPRIFKALENETNEVTRDYIYISLYTGARKANVLAMRWDEINFTTKEWRIPKTKNGDAVSLPLIKEAIEILKERKKQNAKIELEDLQREYVFPSVASKSGHLTDPKKAWYRILKEAQVKNLRLHDIRRTLGSYQAITGASLPIIGKSLGHKSSQATQIYSRMNLDPVRESMEKAISLIGKYGGNKK
jgi:integrase